MTILITGGAGFIGSNFVHFMLRKHPEYRIINLDKLTYAGNLENLEEVEDNPRYVFEHGDICDRATVEKILSRHNVGVIINFAAESHVDRSILQSSEFVSTNVQGTNVLLDLAKEHKLEKYIQVSTDEVYGSLGSTGTFTETTPLHPNSPYAASKASADLLVAAYHHTFGLPTIITRCTNNYGPYQFPEKLIPLMIINALSDKPLPVYGDGKNVRDWIHVTDHCAAIDVILHRGNLGEVYHIGGNNEVANIDVVKLILRHLKKSESLISYVKDRPGHDRRYAMDASKLQKELGWQPVYSFEQGLEETIDWYIRHESWWKHIISGEYQEYYKRMYEER